MCVPNGIQALQIRLTYSAYIYFVSAKINREKREIEIAWKISRIHFYTSIYSFIATYRIYFYTYNVFIALVKVTF